MYPLGTEINRSSSIEFFSLLKSEAMFRVVVRSQFQLELEPIAAWDSLNGLQYTSPVELVMEERDGMRVPLRSFCPKYVSPIIVIEGFFLFFLRSTCSTERRLRVLTGSIPLVKQSLESVPLVVLAGLSYKILKFRANSFSGSRGDLHYPFDVYLSACHLDSQRFFHFLHDFLLRGYLLSSFFSKIQEF